ncbi:MAG: DUF4446 family protein [Fimbriimonadia bacterium]|nr:DUF4446 family protein [Fimbriimonadia bacterium]
MDWQTVEDWVTRPEYLLTLGILVALMLLWSLVFTLRWGRFQRQWRQLMQGAESHTLETMLYENLRRLSQLEEIIKRQGSHLEQLQTQADGCLQKFGALRFDAFEDVGGQQSFAVALLNQHSDGLVLSGIHSRQEMRVYAKSLNQAQAEVGLSEEEKTAIQRAQKRTQSA